MDRFVARQNVIHYRLLLETEQDPEVRAQIEHLLAEALREVQALDSISEKPKNPP